MTFYDGQGGATAILKWLPAIILGGGIILSYGDSQSAIQTNVMKGELLDKRIEKQSIQVAANEEAVEEIQRILIRRQGEIDLDLQIIQSQQEQQSRSLKEQGEALERTEETLDDILQLLIRRENNDRTGGTP